MPGMLRPAQQEERAPRRERHLHGVPIPGGQPHVPRQRVGQQPGENPRCRTTARARHAATGRPHTHTSHHLPGTHSTHKGRE